jgi:hypothetical protein
VGETHEASAQHPQEVQRLLAMAQRAREEIGDMDRPGRGQRPAGHVEHPVALTPEKQPWNPGWRCDLLLRPSREPASRTDRKVII